MIPVIVFKTSLFLSFVSVSAFFFIFIITKLFFLDTLMFALRLPLFVGTFVALVENLVL